MKFKSNTALMWNDLNNEQRNFLDVFASDFPAWKHNRFIKKLNPVDYAFMIDNRLIVADGPYMTCTPTGLAVYNTRTIQLESD